MLRRKAITSLLVGAFALGPIAGCENLPGNEKEQGAVIGGVGGAAAGAAIAKDNRILGALIGGALGAGGGYLVGANWDKISGKKKEDAEKSVENARTNPATVEDVKNSQTADLNDDGFVTLDEVVAMEKAGLKDKDMIKRLKATDQYFELTSDQEQYLRDHNVTDTVIDAMRTMGDETQNARRASDTTEGSQRISHDNPRD
jgi:hypothetical protein